MTILKRDFPITFLDRRRFTELALSGKFGLGWRSGSVTRDALSSVSGESSKAEIPALSQAVSCHLLYQMAVRPVSAMSCGVTLSEIHGAEKCQTTRSEERRVG